MSFVVPATPDPRWEGIFKQMKQVYEAIIDLGKIMQLRFDQLDMTLAAFVNDATNRLEQTNTTTVQIQSKLISIHNMQKELQWDTRGNYLLEAGLNWLHVQDDCFPSADTLQPLPPVSEAALIKRCRDEIALFAINSPPVAVPGPVNLNRSVLADLGAALAQDIPTNLPEHDVQPDPKFWLAASKMLLELGFRHPEYLSLLLSSDKDPRANQNLSLLAVMGVGQYFRELTRQLALVHPDQQPKLRRDLIDGIIDEYATTIHGVIQSVDGLSNEAVAGMPNPNIPVSQLSPALDPKLYPFMSEPIDFCTAGDRVKVDTFAMYSTPGVFGWWNHTDFDRFFGYFSPVEIKLATLPPSALAKIPKSLLTVLTSSGLQNAFGKMKITACFNSIHVSNEAHAVYGSNFTFHVVYELILKASYLDPEQNLVKDEQVTRWQIESTPIFFFPSFSPLDRPMLTRLWNGTPPEGPSYLLKGFESHIQVDPEYNVDLPEAKPQFGRFFVKKLRAEGKDIVSQIGECRLNSSGEIDATAVSNGRFASADQIIHKARQKLALIFEFGLANNNPAVSDLLNFIASPENLPMACSFARSQFDFGSTPLVMKAALDRRLALLKGLVDAVERSPNLEPGVDLFGPRLAALHALARRAQVRP
jgi:hypothetical protein